MSDVLNLSRYKLQQFLTCQRRFQLRYQAELPWPAPPPDAEQARAADLGGAFHQILARHFLGLPVEIAAEAHELAAWWRTFQEQGPRLPAGQRWPEASLTVPLGRHLLTGRFDLVIYDHETNSAHIFDWKTERRPRRAADLATDWQTRLYLALMTRGSQAITHSPAPLPPENVHLTYWFVNAPAAQVTFAYDQVQYEQTWSKLTTIAAAVDERLAVPGIWPLTTDLTACGRCAYRVYCGRPEAPAGGDAPDYEAEAPPDGGALEPAWQ